VSINTHPLSSCNASSVVMGSGAYSSAASNIVLGVGASASGAASISIGSSPTCTGANGVSIGNQTTCGVAQGVSLGYISSCAVEGDISIGQYSGGKGNGSKLSLRVCGSTGISSNGDNQSGIFMPHRITTDVTATNMTTSNTANSTVNLLGQYNNSSHACIGTVIAREGATGDSAMWEVKFLMKRGANASATVLVGTPTVTKLFNDTGAAAWTLTVNADTTNGGVYFVATGETAKTIKWSSNIQYSMVAG